MRKKRGIALLAALVCVVALGTAAVTWADDDVPTVIFDATAKTFRFQHCEKYTDGSGTRQYPNLFRDGSFIGMMPGDSATQTIKVKVINAGSNKVKMTVRAENQNDDYLTLLNTNTAHPATLNASFAAPNPADLSFTKKALSLLRKKDQTVVTYSEPLGENGTYLGEYTGSSMERTVYVEMNLPIEAGNEYQNLTAEVDWVFIAEIIPAETPGPGPGGGGGGGGGELPPEPPLPPGSDPSTPGYTPGPFDPAAPPMPSDEERTWLVGVTPHHIAYIIGRTDGLVHPEAPITRAEAATIFFRLMAQESRERYWTTQNGYFDVSPVAWHNNAISTMTRAGVLTGYPDESFQPNRPITRAEFTAMVSRIVKANRPIENTFTDVKDHWAKSYIDNAVSLEIIEGYEDGTFRPNQIITRAEVMAICNRMLIRIPHLDGLLADMIFWPDNQNKNSWYYLDVQEATNGHQHTMGEHYEIWNEYHPYIDWTVFEKPESTANSFRSDGIFEIN